MAMALSPRPITALFKRELFAYFTNPAAYVFITLFVFLSGVAAFWSDAFFVRNMATLDELSRWFPALLLLLIPAITMAAWAEERKQGTDEILLTLPAREWQLALGKYLGCLAIYAVCLAFAASHLIVLQYLGRPDVGLVASTYLGYFLAGAALCGVGLFASAISASSTIAYIAAAVACGLLVGLGLIENAAATGRLADNAGWWPQLVHTLTELSIPARMENFARGVINPGDVLYFVLIATLGVLMTSWVLAQRRRVGLPISGGVANAVIRLASLLVILGCLVTLADRARVRADATAERLWTLSPQTGEALAKLPKDQPIDITAYISSNMPTALASQEEQLRGTLRELEARSGGVIRGRVVATEPRTAEARDAERAFAIKPRTVPSDDGVGTPRDVFLSVAVASSTGRFTTIPFLSRGLPVEYELVRAIQSVSASAKRTIGIVETAAGLHGSFDFQSMQSRPDWPIIAELAKQYNVRRVSPGADFPSDVDVLLVAQPSSLDQAAVDRLTAWVKSGKGTMIWEDPLPLVNPAIATAEPKSRGNPMMGQPPDNTPKANLQALWDVLGASIKGDSVVWDTSNRRPSLAQTPNEFVWAAPLPALGYSPFDASSPITSGLQEVVLLFAGRIDRAEKKTDATGAAASGQPTFTSLIRSSPKSGSVPYSQMITRNFLGMSEINPNRRPTKVGMPSTMAAAITGGEHKLNVVLVADIDMFSPTFFSIREQGAADLQLDNVPLVLNAIDTLAGEQGLLDLRKKRPMHRTLERIDARRQGEIEDTLRIEEATRADAESRVSEARARLEAKVKEVSARTDLDDNAKAITVESVRRAEQTRLDALIQSINSERDDKIEDARLVAQQNIRKIESAVRIAAVSLPPVPALLTGVFVLHRRRRLAEMPRN